MDLTQGELAARVPCAKGTVRRLESDDLRPSKQLAERLAEVLGIDAAARGAFVAFARSGDIDVFVGGVERSPMWQTRKSLRPGLPAAANALIGRSHIASLAGGLLQQPDVRLLTLIGPPGVGKTRLALHVAGEIAAHFSDGACFVTLAPLRGPQRVLPAIAQALDLLDSGRPIADAVSERLRDENLLLVLDNFEHVIEAATDVAALLAAAPALKVLCTSRVPLRIFGEHEFVVPPLALPDLKSLPDVTVLQENSAVALFMARAQAVVPDFRLSAENAPAIALICHRLDGLPLAIELAATRIKLFSVEDLLARLDQRLPFLVGGPRDAPARQRTLESAIAWSHDLLDDAEKACLARLSVFSGGWTLDAARAVCSPEVDADTADDRHAAVEDILASLLDKSLIQIVSTGSDRRRFGILETIREFAQVRLRARNEIERIAERHARYFLVFAIEAERGLQGAEQARWMARLMEEMNNVRAALSWSMSPNGDVELGLRAAAALWWFWWTYGLLGEGRAWLDQLLARDAKYALHARALLGLGILSFFAGDFTAAMAALNGARDAVHQTSDAITLGYAMFMIGTVQTLSSHAQGGLALLDEGRSILRSAGAAAAWYLGVTSLASTLLAFERGDMGAAERYADEGMAVFRGLGQPYGIGLALNYQGDVARMRGDYSTASERYAAALPLLRQAGAKSELPAVLHNLANATQAQGDYAQAEMLLAEALALHHDNGNRAGVAECLNGFAAAALAQGNAVRAARLLGAVDALLVTLNLPLFAAEQEMYLRTAEGARAKLGDRAWTEEFQIGRASGYSF